MGHTTLYQISMRLFENITRFTLLGLVPIAFTVSGETENTDTSIGASEAEFDLVPETDFQDMARATSHRVEASTSPPEIGLADADLTLGSKAKLTTEGLWRRRRRRMRRRRNTPGSSAAAAAAAAAAASRRC